jgi:negative regulator of flagellin synthesis FlgM
MIIDSNSNSVNSSSTSSMRSKSAQATADNKNAAPAAPAAKTASDSVSLSNKAQAMGRLEAQIASAPDVDEAKVAAVKAAIAEGRYQVDSQTVAERMLAEDSLLG